MSDGETREDAERRERLAVEAALRVVEADGPLAGHPAHASAWRRRAARELVDPGMER